MLKRLLLLIVAASSSISASAESWDSNQNIDRALDKAVKTYKAGKINSLVVEGKNCYAGLDTGQLNQHLGRDVEYCIALEASAMMINRDITKEGGPRIEYLDAGEVIVRAMYYLETSRIVRQPAEFVRYLTPRLDRINMQLPGKM